MRRLIETVSTDEYIRIIVGILCLAICLCMGGVGDIIVRAASWDTTATEESTEDESSLQDLKREHEQVKKEAEANTGTAKKLAAEIREMNLRLSDEAKVIEKAHDELDDLDVELDPDEFLADWGESMFFDTDHYHGKYRYDIGYVYDAQIDGRTYYIYVRVCTRDDQYRNDIGLEQFIVCTEDKIDELYEIIEDDDADIYLDVL